MTAYAMPAHLALNLCWLWLFLGRRWWMDGLAIMVAFVDLSDELPGAVVGKATDSATGLTVRVVEQYNAETDEVIRRLDVLYGFQVVRGALMARIQG